MRGLNSKVSIRDLFYYCLLRWRLLIIFVAVGSLLFCLYENRIDNEESSETEFVFDESQVTDRVRQRVFYQGQINSLREYMSSSLLMQLNPAEVYRVEEIYYISGQEDISHISNYWDTALGSSLYLEKVGEYVGVDSQKSCLGEIVETSVNENLISIIVNCGDEEFANLVSEAIERVIEELYKNNQETVGDYQLIHDSSNIVKTFVLDCYEKQYARREALTELISYCGRLYNEMSETEKEYVAYLLNGVVPVVPEKESESPFLTVLGLSVILLTVVGMMSIACVYLLNCRLMNCDELSFLSVMPIVEVDRGLGRRKGISGWLIKKRYRHRHIMQEASADGLVREIEVDLDKLGAKNVLFTGSCLEKDDQELIQSVVQKLQNAQYVENITNIEGKEILVVSDTICLVEVVEKSQVSTIKEEIEVSTVYGVKNVLFIVLYKG